MRYLMFSNALSYLQSSTVSTEWW